MVEIFWDLFKLVERHILQLLLGGVHILQSYSPVITWWSKFHLTSFLGGDTYIGDSSYLVKNLVEKVSFEILHTWWRHLHWRFFILGGELGGESFI